MRLTEGKLLMVMDKKCLKGHQLLINISINPFEKIKGI